MAQEHSGVEETVARWRAIIMDKRRQIITPEETLEQKIASIWPWITPDTEPVEGWEYRHFRYTRTRERVFEDETWRPIRVGETWGGEADISAQFRCTARMPERFKGQKVVLKLYLGGDGLLSVNGRPYHGLDPFRDTIPLTREAAGDETYDLFAESYIFWHFGEGIDKPFEASHFAVVDEEMKDAYWDLRCAYKVMVTEQIEPGVRGYLQAVLHKALDAFDQNETSPGCFRAAVRQARDIVRADIYESGVFRREGLMHLPGNAHLDVCYLWTHAEFVRKLGRTHATVLRLMEEYPDYIFTQSQPLMYQEMKDTYPEMYEEVQARVREGRWEVIGAFWVEPDCNLVSGESFVRQLLHGIRFIRKEFNREPRTAWLPDVFGNMWSMPQILARCGLRYFVTHKMTMWNDTNKWDKHVFWWKGPDGSRVLGVVPPTLFIGTMEPSHMAEHWQRYSARGTVGESLYNYGWGDGGGGPDMEMLESVKRYANFPGMVPTRNSTNEECLLRIEAKAVEAGDAIPVMDDELYLEEHRGTYTTKGIFKKLNRRCERLYRKAELFSAVGGKPYPLDELNRGWRTILTNQFHDSLPGSHVTIVHEDLLESYQEPLAIGERALHEALEAIVASADTRGDGQAAVVFNSLSHPRDTVVRVAMEPAPLHVTGEDGAVVPHQFIIGHETGASTLVFPAKGLPACGYAVYRIHEGAAPQPPASPLKVTRLTLDNDRLRVTLNDRGELVSLFDKESKRETIDSSKRGNVFCLFEDEPGKLHAWDIVSTYVNTPLDMTGETTLDVVEEGPVRAAVQVTRTFRDSRIVQRIVLYRDAKRLDFETYVDWHEQKKLLKTRFHTTIRSRTAAYDIPFATIERPTTRNNSFEEARFEVPAHYWMDLSQADYGLSLLNDCKYGHEAHGSMMGLTMLKGAVFPDPVADQGEHWFTYSLAPHAGDWRDGRTHALALDLNDPADVVLTGAHAGEAPANRTFLGVDAPNVHVEALKKAEDSDALIVRLVEREGATSAVTVTLPRPIQEASETNLLEVDESRADFEQDRLQLVMRPYEIRTFRVVLR